MPDIKAWNQRFIEGYRADRGKVGGNFEGVPLLILHTTGARSGEARENPLVYLRNGNSFVVFASGGGAPRHPDWYYNLVAIPHTAIEVGTEVIEVTARVAEGGERDWLWDLQKRCIPAFAEHEQTTTRRIPVIVLEPVS
jgi:deazaflavin-dependent oxidoreductase (nitroreductase family)